MSDKDKPKQEDTPTQTSSAMSELDRLRAMAKKVPFKGVRVTLFENPRRNKRIPEDS